MRWRILAILVMAPLLAVALAYGATRTVNDEPVQAATRASSIVWSDRVITTRKEMASWLSSHGARYDRWAQRHPGAAKALK